MTGNGTDVVVVGDGPAGTAIAAALTERRVPTLLVGSGDAWAATYGTWVDAVPDPISRDPDVWASVSDGVDVAFGGAVDEGPRRDRVVRVLRRSYGVFDNDRLRALLSDGVDRRTASVERVDGRPGELEVHVDSGEPFGARLVVDATGWPGALGSRPRVEPRAWQIALGVVLAEPPEGPLGRPILMDWSRPPSPHPAVPATFLYALPVDAGWLLEETVLATADDLDPAELADPLAARLGTSADALLRAAVSVERVRIPMGTPSVGVSADGIVPFGAAAGSVHPATGYSVADSLATAARVADAIGLALRGSSIDDDSLRTIERSLWPAARLRSRALHDFGLDVLLSLSPDETREFFATFFELDDGRWPAYLDAEVDPRALSSTMLAMFRRAPWRLRRRMVTAGRLLATAGSVARPAPSRSPRRRRR